MTADAYSGNKTGRKNLSLVLEFFKSTLELYSILFGFAWFMVLATIFLAWVGPRPANFVQEWWFYSSVHLVFIQTLALALFAKALLRAGNAQWVPGWYQAHSQALAAWLLALVSIPFLVGAAFALLPAETWDPSLLPWLVFSVSAAVVVAFLSPFKEPGTRQLLTLITIAGTLELLLIGSQSSKTFSFPWLVWSVLRDWPWCTALITSCVALVLYRRPAQSNSGTFNAHSWASLSDTFAIGPKMPNRWLSLRRWPLLNGTFFSGGQIVQCFVFLPQLPGVIRSGPFAQVMFYWFILICLAMAISIDMKFARQARLLMWIPGGLSRQTLGKDMFYLLLRRHAFLVVSQTLVFTTALMLASQPLRFLLEPSVLFLAISYCIFSAGWTAAFCHHRFGRVFWVTMRSLPVLVFGIPLSVAMLAKRSEPHLISEPTQIALAIAFALAGWYLGQRHTAHWSEQEFESLLQPAKRLT